METLNPKLEMLKQTMIGRFEFILGVVLLFGMSIILQINAAIPAFLLTLVGYRNFFCRSTNGRKDNLLNLSLLFVTIFIASFFIITNGWPVFCIPFSTVPLLASILFSTPVIALMLTVASAVTIASIGSFNFYLLILFLISGIVAIILTREVRRRNVIIRAGLIIGIVQSLTLLLLKEGKISGLWPYLTLFANGIASSIIVVGILPVFEYLFKTVTNIRLLELADFDNPLLQRLMMEAPGTYHHSLVVGNLSEAACQAVNAHALLARIGAYYHDIGKLSKPEYFSENQDSTGTKHDTISPRVSKMVIMNHVREGVDLARRFRLNDYLIDFIQQHHGTSLVYYFYRRALENSEHNQEVGEEEFRYLGPKPNSKETAIVLLADSVEAAARTLKEPTSTNIEDMVHKVINNKFIDGQLDECTLTLKDLEKISKVFTRILGGIYHSRIPYPENPK